MDFHRPLQSLLKTLRHKPMPPELVDPAQLLAIATEARAFLEPLWRDAHFIDGRDFSHVSERMCCVSSRFLQKVMKQRRIKSDFCYGNGEGKYGFFDGKKMHMHGWPRVGNMIVAITEDQFDQQPVIITTIDDPRYRAPICNSYALEHKDHSRLTLWWEEWQFRLAHNLDRPPINEAAQRLSRFSS